MKPELTAGDLLVKDGKRYEYCGERRMAGAPGFLIRELDGTYLEGWRPHWAPQHYLTSFEPVPAPPADLRQRYAECAYPKCWTPVNPNTCGRLPGFNGKRYACAAHDGEAV